MNRKRLLVVAVAVFVVLFVVVALLVGGNQKKPSSTSTSDGNTSPPSLIDDSPFHVVTVTNSKQYASQIEASMLVAIQEQLYQKVQSVIDAPKTSYEGIIRSGSVTTSFTEYDGGDTPIQVPVTDFLVDIPAVQQTYHVSLSGGEKYPYNIVYVLCPSSDQLIYPAFACSDEQ